MEKEPKKRAAKGRLITEKKLPLPAKPVPSADVERVLEHITSPYRWELLEVPPVKPAVSIPKKSIHQKLSSRK